MEDINPKLPGRGIKMLRMYEQGHTLEEIGSLYELTRERVRQIIRKSAILELAELSGVNPKDKNTYQSLSQQVDFLLHQIKSARKESKLEHTINEINQRLKDALDKGINPESFISLSLYSKYTGVKEIELKEYRPDIIETILNNKRKKWSWYYSKCRSCGTISVKHRSLGYCKLCYPKSPEFKEMQAVSFQKNYQKRAEYTKKYAEEYYKRPEVRKRHLELAFEGNREKAIERDFGKCKDCGIARDESMKKYGKDLFVCHIDNNPKNNDINNLRTLCWKCFQQISKF